MTMRCFEILKKLIGHFATLPTEKHSEYPFYYYDEKRPRT
jgi:hypothetical protein